MASSNHPDSIEMERQVNSVDVTADLPNIHVDEFGISGSLSPLPPSTNAADIHFLLWTRYSAW